MNPPADTTILVVDDNEAKRYSIRSRLTRAGYQVAEASSGVQALALLRSEPVDAVLLDVRLPDISGFEVCEQIKNDPATQALPVVHMSAVAVRARDRTQGLARGADAYLVEPIDPEELLATVHAVLRYYRARQRAERLASRLARLAQATSAINSARTFSDLLRAASAGARLVFEASAVVIVVAPDGQALAASMEAAGGDSMVGPIGGLADVLQPQGLVGTNVRYEAGKRWRRVVPWAEPDGVWLATARAKEKHPPTLVAVQSSGFVEDDQHVLRQFGQAVALAVEALWSYDLERRIAVTLQRSLLPHRLPDVPGVEIAVRYAPASEYAEVGGDFYELVEIDGILHAAIGDVAGHSLHAATVMAELRHALRAYCSEGHSPAAALDRLNALMLRFLPAEVATVCLLTLDPLSGLMRLANAGHPPPMLAYRGKCTPIGGRAPLLGVDVGRNLETETVLPTGSTLVLITDGLVERRGHPIEEGLVSFRQAAATVEPVLDDYCDRLVARLAGFGQDDDIALLAIRRLGPPHA